MYLDSIYTLATQPLKEILNLICSYYLNILEEDIPVTSRLQGLYTLHLQLITINSMEKNLQKDCKETIKCNILLY